MGDAWHQKYSTDKEGLTLAITRSDLSEEIIKDLGILNKITYWEESYDETNEVMDDPNNVENLELKTKMYKNKSLRKLIPMLVFFEQYIINFPFNEIRRRLLKYVRISNKK